MVSGDFLQYQLQHLKNLVFEVTDECNLNCKYCAFSDIYRRHDKREGKKLSFDKARILLDYVLRIRDYPADVVYPLVIGFYGGEPMLNMAFINQVVDYIEKMPDVHRYVSYNMTTNAIVLDKYMDFFAEKEFALTISLDGDSFGQSYRVDHSGNNSFDRVFRNTKLLQEKYPEYFQRSVHFHAVLHKRNTIESIFRFINDNFAKSPTIATVSDSGVNSEKVSEFRKIFENVNDSYQKSNNCEYLDSEMFIRSPRIAALSSHIRNCSGNVFDSYSHLIFSKSNTINLTTGTCIPFSKKLFLTVNGKLLPCERIDHCFVMGQLLDDRVDFFDFEDIAKSHNLYVTKFSEQCKICGINRGCSVCVYHVDDIREENILCPKYTAKEKQEQQVGAIFDYLRDHPYCYRKILKEVRTT